MLKIIRSEYAKVALILIASRVLIVLIVALALKLGAQAAYHPCPDAFPSHPFWSGFARWDSYFYHEIATAGYTQIKSTAFFPLYPALMSFVGNLMGNVWAAGLIISNICWLIAGSLFYKLSKFILTPNESLRALFYLSIFPGAIFFTAVYSESLFLTLALASIIYYLKRNLWLAGIWGAWAILVRPTGLALAAALVITEIWHYRRRIWKLWHSLQLLLLPLIALIILFIINWLSVGDPFSFIKAQRLWDRTFTDPISSFINSVKRLNEFNNAINNVELYISVIATIIVTVLLIKAIKEKYPTIFYIYAFTAWALMLCVGHLHSIIRFILVIFPVIYYLAHLAKRWWLHYVLTSLFVILNLLITWQFSVWYWAG